MIEIQKKQNIEYVSNEDEEKKKNTKYRSYK